MFVIKAENCSMKEWIEICEFNPQYPEIRIDLDKTTIIILDIEELDIIKKFINGTLNRREELFSSVEKDILGNIEGFNLNEEVEFEYFDSSTDINDIVDTRGSTFHYHNSFGDFQDYKDKDGEYLCEFYAHRKGYPSFMFKIWNDNQRHWVE